MSALSVRVYVFDTRYRTLNNTPGHAKEEATTKTQGNETQNVENTAEGQSYRAPKCSTIDIILESHTHTEEVKLKPKIMSKYQDPQ